jgi:lipoyl(octanoyl) transferase
MTAMSPHLCWRVHRDGAGSGSWNMALDHALAETLPGDTGEVRFYAWKPHTISFGRNEPSRDLYDVEAAAAEGLAFVRRPTGCRAVLHAHEVTYSVALPLRALGGVRAAYRRINEGLVEGLRLLGVAAAVSDEGVSSRPDAGPCFQLPAPGEVVASARKLVGSAQARVGRSLLQHGSVILRGDQSALWRLTGRGDRDPAPPATVEEAVSSAVDPDRVADALARGLRLALGGDWAEGSYRPEQLEVARRLEAERYGRDRWTWRR